MVSSSVKNVLCFDNSESNFWNSEFFFYLNINIRKCFKLRSNAPQGFYFPFISTSPLGKSLLRKIFARPWRVMFYKNKKTIRCFWKVLTFVFLKINFASIQYKFLVLIRRRKPRKATGVQIKDFCRLSKSQGSFSWNLIY